MPRTAIGPFSLNTDEALDSKIIEFFETARSRGKSDLFREIMKVYFGGHPELSETAMANEAIMRKLDLVLSAVKESRVVIRSYGDDDTIETGIDDDDPALADTLSALDQLGGL